MTKETYKKDFLGNELKVGDEVVFMQVSYRTLMKGTIAKLNDKKAIIHHHPTNTYKTKSLQFYNQIIKIL